MLDNPMTLTELLQRDTGIIPAGTKQPWIISGMRHLTLTAGEIDADAITWFIKGQCHALAFAIHEATGWPLRWAGPNEYDTTCIWRDEEYLDDNLHVGEDHFQIYHLYVETPAGTWLDIEGEHAPDEVHQHYARKGSLDGQLLRKLVANVEENLWHYPVLPLARSFVPTLTGQQVSA